MHSAGHSIIFSAEYPAPYLESRNPAREKAKRALWLRIVAQEAKEYHFRGSSIDMLSMAQQFASAAASESLTIEVLFAKIVSELKTDDDRFVVQIRAVQVCRAL